MSAATNDLVSIFQLINIRKHLGFIFIARVFSIRAILQLKIGLLGMKSCDRDSTPSRDDKEAREES